jgi:hypothetical protein
MLLSLQSRLCGNIFVIHCQGRIVVGEEASPDFKSRDALDAAAVLL